jgi:predicted nucleic acid-binding protein
MPEAISDTGPVLHLHEIGRLKALGVFTHLTVPGLVADELHFYGLDLANLGIPDLTVAVAQVSETRRDQVLAESAGPPIHPADAEVLVLAQDDGFRTPVLTDDLALRRRLEASGATVSGSVGILVRAYKVGTLTRSQLENAVDALFAESTLHLSRAFQVYVRKLVAELP